MEDFVHLHVHTQYSILDGQASIPKLVDKALKDGMRGMAITDHGNMMAIKEFFNYTTKKNSGTNADIKMWKKRIALLENGEDAALKEWVDGQKNDDGTFTPGYYELRQLDLFEVSICPIGMNQATEVSAKKALLGLDPDFKPQPPEPRTEGYYKKRPCPEMVFCAASILETYLEQNPE